MNLSALSLKKYVLLGSLYVSQFMPFWFLFQALPVILRKQGASLEAIGALPVLLIPISFKFLWSPLIDAYGFTRWGHYRFWIVFFQIIVAAIAFLCSFLSVEEQLPLVLIALAAIAIGSSTQDIATDALALGLLRPEERGSGNAVQGIGGAIGRAIGGGGMLILLDRIGWQFSLLSLAGMMLISLIPLLLYREKIKSKPRLFQTKKASSSLSLICKNVKSYCQTFLEFYRLPGVKTWLAILALATSGYNLSATMFRPLLADIGWSLEEIGWLMGVYGMAMTVLGSFVGGILISRLGRKSSFLVALTCSGLGVLSLLLPAWGLTQPSILYAVVALSLFAVGITGTTTFTIMMDKSRAQLAGTDFTLQSSVIPLFSIVSAGIGGFLAERIGYAGVFLMGSLLLLSSIAFTLRYTQILALDRSPVETTLL